VIAYQMLWPGKAYDLEQSKEAKAHSAQTEWAFL
jgi:hypothetical protein